MFANALSSIASNGLTLIQQTMARYHKYVKGAQETTNGIQCHLFSPRRDMALSSGGAGLWLRRGGAGTRPRLGEPARLRASAPQLLTLEGRADVNAGECEKE